MNSGKRTTGILVLLLAALAPFGRAAGQETKCTVQASWAPPATGSKPVLYHAWVRARAFGETEFGAWEEWPTTPEPSEALNLDAGFCYQVKVQAEDAEKHLGPFSIPSEEFCCGDEDQGPGQPGQPVRLE